MVDIVPKEICDFPHQKVSLNLKSPFKSKIGAYKYLDVSVMIKNKVL